MEKNTHGGAGRGQGRHVLPPEQKMVARLIDLPQSTWDDLAVIAKKHGKARNAYIRQILQHAIDLDLSTSPGDAE